MRHVRLVGANKMHTLSLGGGAQTQKLRKAIDDLGLH